MMKVFVSIKLRCVIGKFDTMLWGLMRRAFTLFLFCRALQGKQDISFDNRTEVAKLGFRGLSSGTCVP